MRSSGGLKAALARSLTRLSSKTQLTRRWCVCLSGSPGEPPLSESLDGMRNCAWRLKLVISSSNASERPMIIEMPFLHRIRAATAKTPEPREMAAWDSERLALAEMSKADFEKGAEVGHRTLTSGNSEEIIETIVLDGRHWAELTKVYPDTKSFEHGLDPISYALMLVADQIDCTRFFSGGREKIAQTSILKKTPRSEYVHSSQREVNVANLTDWVESNLVSVDGTAYARVREPTVYLDFIGPFHGEQSFAELQMTPLTAADSGTRYEHGMLATISDRFELTKLARDLEAKDSRIMHYTNKIGAKIFKTMRSYAEDPADVAGRSMMNLARHLHRRTKHVDIAESLHVWLHRFIKKNDGDADIENMDQLADMIGRNVGVLGYPDNLRSEIVLDRWHNRPIDLGIGRPGPHGPARR